MKKTVPFQKDINFGQNISEINSIALEHDLTTKEAAKIEQASFNNPGIQFCQMF